MEWSDSWRGAFRIELRAEAIGFASRGWPVLPGTYPADGNWIGRDHERENAGGAVTGRVDPAPVHVDWAARVEQLGLARQPDGAAETVANWWGGRPYSLLVATGTVLDAIEVDARLGKRTAVVLRRAGGPVPIVATPAGQWLFLTRAGAACEEFTNHFTDQGAHGEPQGVVVHGAGSWVPLPPTPYPHGIAHWRVKPEICGWRLPEPHVVRDAVLRAAAGGDAAVLVTATAPALSSGSLPFPHLGD